MWGMPSPFRWRTPHSTLSQVNYCLSFLGGGIAMAEHNLHSVAFPTLEQSLIDDLSRCSSVTTKTYRDGQTLFSVGDREFKNIIVKSGEVEIVDHSGDQPKTVTVHRKGQFTGDVSHLTGNPAVVSAVARGDTEVYEVSGDTLRRILNQCPTAGDIILQAFIARRQLLRASADFTGLRVIGSPTLPTPSVCVTSWPKTACCSPGR